MIHTLPLAMALRRARPDVDLVWIAQPESRPLLEGHPAVSRIECFPRRSSLRAIARALARLRALRVDLLLDPQGNLKSALIARCVRARRRIGVHPADAREWPNRHACSEHVTRCDHSAHVVDRYLGFASHLGVADLAVDFGLAPTSAERAEAERRLTEAGLAPPTPVVVLQVGDLGDARQWYADRMAAVADALARERGYGAAVTTGPAHVVDGRQVVALVRDAALLDACGRLDLRGLLALFSALADRPGSFLLSGDTAPVHLAIAAGLRVLGLYGSQPARRTGPYGALGEVLSLEGALPCVPCRRRHCSLHDEPRACMERIGVEDVLRRIPAVRIPSTRQKRFR